MKTTTMVFLFALACIAPTCAVADLPRSALMPALPVASVRAATADDRLEIFAREYDLATDNQEMAFVASLVGSAASVALAPRNAGLALGIAIGGSALSLAFWITAIKHQRRAARSVLGNPQDVPAGGSGIPGKASPPAAEPGSPPGGLM